MKTRWLTTIRRGLHEVKMVLETGISVEHVDFMGEKALWAAVRAKNYEIINYLFEKGASAHAYPEQMFNLLHLVICVVPDMMEIFIENGVGFYKDGTPSLTDLRFAIMYDMQIAEDMISRINYSQFDFNYEWGKILIINNRRLLKILINQLIITGLISKLKNSKLQIVIGRLDRIILSYFLKAGLYELIDFNSEIDFMQRQILMEFCRMVKEDTYPIDSSLRWSMD